MTPKLSIIIPCYNAELTLESTLRSVQEQKYQDWEAIIVNDGSTDNTEKLALSWVEKDQRFKYYSKHNEGLGKTRNFGISHSIGEYILPLDADNLVEMDFAEKALLIFDENFKIGVVHGCAQYFGEKEGVWQMGEFSLKKILLNNYIDACAIYKKSLWEKVGGYDENMPYQGHEDWDFWIKVGVENVKFYFMNEITFRYYVNSLSMIHSFTNEMYERNKDYIIKKHSRIYYNYYSDSLLSLNKLEDSYARNLKSEKFVINTFTKMFFGFNIFRIQQKKND